MYKCTKCGQEFDGNFCPACGAKAVDPNGCPKCGAPLAAEDVKFCQVCGARLDGKINCPKCGAELDEGVAFCTKCGAKLGGDKDEESGEGHEKLKKIFSLVGTLCFLTAAFIGFIFTFFAGFTYRERYGDEMIRETEMLYYYFGDAFKDLDLLNGTTKAGIYIPRVLGALISVLGIAATIAFAIVTIVKVCKKYAQKQENVSVIGPAVGTFMSFATMSTLLLALVVENNEDYFIRFSAPTLAGMIMGGIALTSGIALLAIANYNSLKGFGQLFSFIVMAVTSLFLIIVLGLIGAPATSLESKELRMEGSYSLFSGMTNTIGYMSDSRGAATIAFATIGGIVSIVLIILAAVTLIKNIACIANGKKRNNLGYCIAITVLSIVYLVFAILTRTAIIDGYLEGMGVPDSSMSEYRDMINSTYVAPVAMLVVSIMALGASIAGKVVSKKYNVAEE